MPRKKFDKANSTTFQVVHRPQNDPKLHDPSSSSVVFQEVAPAQHHKIKSRKDLEDELFNDSASDTSASRRDVHLRDNEGEAAEYGIYYDDTEYDYMQHMRDINSGTGDGESFFIEAKDFNQEKGKKKEKQSLEEALRSATLDGKAQALLGEDALPSKDLSKPSYQDQQDVPDALAGFQPDMDPRLREVLEALEDDTYVDDEEKTFEKIVDNGKEISKEDFEDAEPFAEDEDEDAWESDDTERPAPSGKPAATTSDDVEMSNIEDPTDSSWMQEFQKFKADQRKTLPTQLAHQQSSILSGIPPSSASFLTHSQAGGRKKRRKGALTSTSGFSMTSSSLVRTEGLNLLDAQFDRIEEDYNAEQNIDDDNSEFLHGGDDEASIFTQSSNMSSMKRTNNNENKEIIPTLTKAGFEDIMDEFLGGYSTTSGNKKSKRVKKGGWQSGMEQLDEVRKGLGPARTGKVGRA